MMTSEYEDQFGESILDFRVTDNGEAVVTITDTDSGHLSAVRLTHQQAHALIGDLYAAIHNYDKRQGGIHA